MNSKQVKYLDSLWSKIVKIVWKHKCAKCGRTDNLTSHHIIGKRNFRVRWWIDNGICFCFTCHRWGHDNPIMLREYIHRRVNLTALSRLKIESFSKTKPFYDDVLTDLKNFNKALDKP